MVVETRQIRAHRRARIEPQPVSEQLLVAKLFAPRALGSFFETPAPPAEVPDVQSQTDALALEEALMVALEEAKAKDEAKAPEPPEPEGPKQPVVQLPPRLRELEDARRKAEASARAEVGELGEAPEASPAEAAAAKLARARATEDDSPPRRVLRPLPRRVPPVARRPDPELQPTEAAVPAEAQATVQAEARDTLVAEARDTVQAEAATESAEALFRQSDPDFQASLDLLGPTRAEATALQPEAAAQPPVPTPAEMAALAREPLPGLRTKDVPIEIRRSLLAGRVPAETVRALRPLAGAVAPQKLERLDAMLLGAHEVPGTDGSISPKRALEHLVHEGGLERLGEEEQALLLGAVAQAPEDVSIPKAALALSKSGALDYLDAPARRATCTLFAELDGEGRVLLATLAARRCRARSALESHDRDGISLAAHLLSIARYGDLARTHAALAPLAEPWSLPADDGVEGLTATLEHALAEAWPAEHARLLAGLFGPSGQTELAEQLRLRSRGAETLRGCFLELPHALRPRAHKTPSFLARGAESINADMLASALEHLFDARYSVVPDPRMALERLEGMPGEGDRNPPCILCLRASEGERLFVFDSLHPDHVIVRSPHGKGAGGLGTIRFDPPRRVVDPSRGMDGFPYEIFNERFGMMLIPRPPL